MGATIPVPGKERKQWQIDVTFLMSSWRCIFGQGCQGVLTEPAPELIQGCCSYGAHESEKKVKEKVEKLAKRLGDDEWQFKSVGLKKGVWANAGKDEWRTRLHQDACVFLNRPDFEAGPGCALHLHALNTGQHFAETKPTVCWQLPLRSFDRDEEDEFRHVGAHGVRPRGLGRRWRGVRLVVHRGRRGVHRPEPVYRSMETELRLMLGDAVYDEIVKYCDARLEEARCRSRIPRRCRSRSGAPASAGRRSERE